MNDATQHHIIQNSHHPESWDLEYDSSIFNYNNRDEVGENIVDATRMPTRYLYEMMADHIAMSEEKNGFLRGWEDKHINQRWKFNKKQVQLIYMIISWYERIKDD